METLLSFFSSLILFTAGLFLVVFWLLVALFILVEIVDLVKNKTDGEA